MNLQLKGLKYKTQYIHQLQKPKLKPLDSEIKSDQTCNIIKSDEQKSTSLQDKMHAPLISERNDVKIKPARTYIKSDEQMSETRPRLRNLNAK